MSVLQTAGYITGVVAALVIIWQALSVSVRVRRRNDEPESSY